MCHVKQTEININNYQRANNHHVAEWLLKIKQEEFLILEFLYGLGWNTFIFCKSNLALFICNLCRSDPWALTAIYLWFLKITSWISCKTPSKRIAHFLSLTRQKCLKMSHFMLWASLPWILKYVPNHDFHASLCPCSYYI